MHIWTSWGVLGCPRVSWGIKTDRKNRNQIEHRTGFLQFYVETKKVCSCFASFSSGQEHFTHGMYMTALIRSSDLKNRTDYVL